jgi:hypothetical protein
MNETDRWLTQYGPLDGAWLQAEFAYMMADVQGIHHVRIACMDDLAEMAQYQERVDATGDPGQGEAGDWELTSPHTGRRYMMGCNW